MAKGLIYNENLGVLKKLTLEELRNTKNWKNAAIVFTEDSFKQKYPLRSRTYLTNSEQKYFKDGKISNSLFASCLDGTDNGVRLDWYFGDWKVEYCYIVD